MSVSCCYKKKELIPRQKHSRWKKTYLIIFGYSLSFPWESLHLLYITLASTFAGEYVLGSFNREITDNKIVRTFCVGFHLSHGNSPLCGSSTGGCKIEIHKSPFCKKKETKLGQRLQPFPILLVSRWLRPKYTDKTDPDFIYNKKKRKIHRNFVDLVYTLQFTQFYFYFNPFFFIDKKKVHLNRLFVTDLK